MKQENEKRKSKIKYVAFYTPEDFSSRIFFPAANAKISYIIEVINNLGYGVELFSPCSSKSGYRPNETYRTNENVIHLYKSYMPKNRLIRALSVRLTKCRFFLSLLFNLKKDDVVIVYHSLYFNKLVKILKHFLGFTLILEVEEIYSDVIGSASRKKEEIDYVKIADRYLFSTEMLDNILNLEKKPYAIVYGTYKTEKEISNKLDDGLIHCVYAGTLDPRKGGATAAVAATEFLPSDYHIHILGFGSDIEVQKIMNEVAEVSSRSMAKVTYDGVLSGEKYLQFLQSCDIGLSTQNPDAMFNATSFPSKILSYMANGLRVVSVRIPAIEMSSVGNDVFYYDEQIPEKIAEAIVKIDMKSQYNSRKRIDQLAEEFEEKLKNLIEAL